MKTYSQEKDYWVSSSGILGKSFLFKTLDLRDRTKTLKVFLTAS